jgi:hypothetical protein
MEYKISRSEPVAKSRVAILNLNFLEIDDLAH